jgi:hypothetical protein
MDTSLNTSSTDWLSEHFPLLKQNGVVLIPLNNCGPDTGHLLEMASRQSNIGETPVSMIYLQLVTSTHVDKDNMPRQAATNSLIEFYNNHLPDNGVHDLKECINSKNLMQLPSMVSLVLCGYPAVILKEDKTALQIYAATSILSSEMGSFVMAQAESSEKYEMGSTDQISSTITAYSQLGLLRFLFSKYVTARQLLHGTPNMQVESFTLYAQQDYNNPTNNKLLQLGFSINPIQTPIYFKLIQYKEFNDEHLLQPKGDDIRLCIVWFPGLPLFHCDGKMNNLNGVVIFPFIKKLTNFNSPQTDMGVYGQFSNDCIHHQPLRSSVSH